MDRIDFKKQSDEIGIDIKNLLSLYQLFMDQTENDILELEQYINDHNNKSIGETAHHIKGASLNLELHSMADIAINMQKQSDCKDWDALAALLSSFKEEFNQLQILIHKAENE